MKWLPIEGEVEKMLVSICDAALKAGGMQTLGVINQLLSSVEQHDAKPQTVAAAAAVPAQTQTDALAKAKA